MGKMVFTSVRTIMNPVFPQSLLDIMPPGLSRLLVLFVFKATKDSPKEC